MKVFIFAALLAVAAATEFKVQKGGKTCALLSVTGTVELVASQKGKQVSKIDLPFSGAKVMANSACDSIRLSLTKSVEVWFQFKASSSNWQVTPISTFIPEQVFGAGVNDTEAVNLTAPSLGMFPSKGSYLCNSPTQLNFQYEPEKRDYNYTVSAAITDFQIQSVEKESFVAGKECAADADYLCQSGGATMVVMEGNFTLNITYFKTVTGGKVQKVSKEIQVPAPEDTETSGDCKKGASTQTLNIKFFKTWTLGFVFAKDKDYYSISNISVDYTYDDNLPGHNETGSVHVDLPVSDSYLKASTKGYYTCNAKLDKTKNGVTLSSKDFKYRAFDDESKGFSGDVSECSADEDTSSVVPIAVGAALAGLVVIVLVAYLIGRKRTRKTGYESV